MDISKFEQIKNKARKLIAEDAKQDSHIIKERQMDRERTYRSLKGTAAPVATGFDNIAPSYGSNGSSISRLNEAYVDDSEDKLGAAMDNRMSQFMENRQMGQQIPVAQQMPRQVNKGLPKEILESFSNNYIDQSVFDPNKSILERFGVEGGDNVQPIQENVSQSNYQPSNAKIDYELIKSIVESSVKKYINAFGKKMLTENNDLSMIQVGDKKINLITKSGDLYEATLVKKYNIKDKARRTN